MKHAKILILLTLAATAFSAVPASAAEDQYEEFARQFMPESQAVYERFREDRKRTKAFLDFYANFLRKEDNCDPDFDGAYCVTTQKVKELEVRLLVWAVKVKHYFLESKSGKITYEELKNVDICAAMSAIEWEQLILKPSTEKSFEVFGRPKTLRIPGRNYEFGEYEVTQRQYQTVMRKNPSKLKNPNCPVENVSWDDAVEFCRKLTEHERKRGAISEEQEFRLPTSDEWEHACRARTTTKYYTGDSFEDLARAGWYLKNSEMRTHPVGQKVPNKFGLYDMHGNVSEWTSTPDGPNRVRRGGNFLTAREDLCESSHRQCCSPETSNASLGFRVVLAPVEKPKK